MKVFKRLVQIVASWTMIYLLMAMIIGFDNTNILVKAIIDGFMSWF